MSFEDVRQAQIARELNGYEPPVGPRPGPEWVTLAEAYQMIGKGYNNGLAPFKPLERVKCATNLPGRKPSLLRRRDVERMAVLIREARLGVDAAAAVVALLNQGRVR